MESWWPFISKVKTINIQITPCIQPHLARLRLGSSAFILFTKENKWKADDQEYPNKAKYILMSWGYVWVVSFQFLFYSKKKQKLMTKNIQNLKKIQNVKNIENVKNIYSIIYYVKTIYSILIFKIYSKIKWILIKTLTCLPFCRIQIVLTL